MPVEPSPSAQAAWTLLVQLRTRITTVQLHFRDGNEPAALESVAKLFTAMRDALAARGPGAAEFAAVVLPLMNEVLRPFTARWHRKSSRGALERQDVARVFRAELMALQRNVRAWLPSLERLAAGESAGPLPVIRREAPMLGDVAVAFDRLIGVPDETARFIVEQESAEIATRRQAVGLRADASPWNLVGLALSGGGIRSATFAQGVVEVLASRGLLREVDLLSTVSGGGYLGSFLSTQLNDPAASPNSADGKPPFARAGATESDALRHVRNHSKYLSEGGFTTRLDIALVALRGLVGNLLILFPLLAVAALFASLLEKGTQPEEWLGAAVLVGAVLLLVSLALPGSRFGLGAVRRFCALAAVALAVYWAVEAGYGHARKFVESAVYPSVAISLPVVFAALKAMLPLWKKYGRFLPWLAAMLVPAFFLVIYYGLRFWAEQRGGPEAVVIALGVALVLLWFVDINENSPHAFYRARLALAYLDKLLGKKLPPSKLTQLSQPGTPAPYHCINAALNLQESTATDLRGRNADFFLFSKHFCGSPTIGYLATEKWERANPQLDLATAMTISAAAGNPNMGRASNARFTALLALLNVRLGVWLRKPPAARRRVPPWYLFREMFGSMRRSLGWLNLSDGGHIENLGLYELLRRRCKYVISVDGECDEAHHFASLIQLFRYAEIDLGVKIDIDLDDLILAAEHRTKGHFAFGRISYPDGALGWLLYLKSSTSIDEPLHVLDYQRNHPDFPHQSTADQWFDENQFEAYRALGVHVASGLFAPEILQGQEVATMPALFAALAGTLLECPYDVRVEPAAAS